MGRGRSDACIYLCDLSGAIRGGPRRVSPLDPQDAFRAYESVRLSPLSPSTLETHHGPVKPFAGAVLC